MCFGCSKEPSYRDGSFEYPQHMFWLRNKKANFQLRTLFWGGGLGRLSVSRSPRDKTLNFELSDKQ